MGQHSSNDAICAWKCLLPSQLGSSYGRCWSDLELEACQRGSQSAKQRHSRSAECPSCVGVGRRKSEYRSVPDSYVELLTNYIPRRLRSQAELWSRWERKARLAGAGLQAALPDAAEPQLHSVNPSPTLTVNSTAESHVLSNTAVQHDRTNGSNLRKILMGTSRR